MMNVQIKNHVGEIIYLHYFSVGDDEVTCPVPFELVCYAPTPTRKVPSSRKRLIVSEPRRQQPGLLITFFLFFGFEGDWTSCFFVTPNFVVLLFANYSV